MPSRRAEAGEAVARRVPADAQIARAFIAVAAGLLLAFWVLRPACTSASVHSMLPEFRALAGHPVLVI
jgi:hypothetical protein